MLLLNLHFVNGQYSLTRTYTEEEGLAPGIVNVITQDQYGYIWIGMRNGLSKFDGRNFTTYFGDVNDSLTLKSSEIFDLFHTDEGNIWIATSSGLSFYNRKTNQFTNYNHNDGLKMDVIKKVVQQNDSTLWIGHWFGVDRINIKNWSVTSFSPAGPSRDTIYYHKSPNHIKNLKYIEEDNSMIISHQHYIKRYDIETEKFIKLVEVDVDLEGDIDDFYWINNKEILIITDYDQNYYIVNLSNGQTTKKYNHKKYRLDEIASTSNGQIIVLDKKKGPKVFNPISYEIETINADEADIINETFISLFVDNKDRIWTGTFNGIHVFEPDANRYYVQEGSSISSTVYDPDNNIIIGLDNKAPLMYQNDNGSLTLKDFNFEGINPFGIVYSEFASSFLSFNKEAIIIFDPIFNKRAIVTLSTHIEEYMNEIKEVENGFLISAGQKVYKVSISGEVSEEVSFTKRIFSAYTYDGGHFFSCIGNLFYAKNGVIKSIHQQSSFTRARGLTITGDTSLWFTEIHKGLIEIDLRSENFEAKFHGKSEGLNSQIMYGIYIDGDHFLIPSTYCFYKYDPRSHKVIETYKKGSKYSTYDIAYDIHAIDKNHYATGVTPGIMVFPIRTNAQEISDLSILQIKLRDNDVLYNIPSELELDYKENDINIQLESFYYGEKNDVTYYYKLNNNGQYNLVGNTPDLNFNNLSAGEYNLSIKATAHNHEAKLENAIRIIINPPWWATKWFMLTSFLVLGASIIYWYRRRLKHLKSQHEIEKKLIHLESIALKSQINPHFLFNSLNGIRTLISLKENEKAIKYISHLSQLLRDSLTYHQSNLISLAQELEMNRHYLELEKLRFDEKLTWEINEEINVNLNEIKIPPFTLQPLIENAIHHGIRYIEGQGKIKITTTNQDDVIKIVVLDNGIGLAKAVELQKDKIRLRDHIGLSIVEKRITFLNGKLSIKDRIEGPGVEATITFKLITK